MRDFTTRTIDYRPIDSLKPAKARCADTPQANPQNRKFHRTLRLHQSRPGRAIIADHGQVAAARLLGLEQTSVVPLGDLSANGRQAYALADNKLALNAGREQELLDLEFRALIDAGFEVELTGFSLAERNKCGYTGGRSATGLPPEKWSSLR
jgi:hypothetical protein